MKLIIKCEKDNTYLFPVVHGEHWVDSISDAFIFEVINNKKHEPINLVADIFLDKDCIQLIELKDFNEIEYDYKSVNGIAFSSSEFLKIKKDFNESKNKKFIHYIIYSIVKNQDAYKSISFSKNKKMNNLQEKISTVKKSIVNYDITKEYLKYPFESIKSKKFKVIIKKLKEIL
jgi:hypothetical protein